MRWCFDATKTKVFAQCDLKKYEIIHSEQGVFAPQCNKSAFGFLVAACLERSMNVQFLRDTWFMTLEAPLSEEEKEFYPAGLHEFVSIVKMYVHNRMAFLGSGCDGYALLPVLGKIDHSCNPNCNLTFDAEKAILITNRDIHAGEEITISYVIGILNVPFQQRQKLLLDMRSSGEIGFLCVCERCILERHCTLSFQPLSGVKVPHVFMEYEMFAASHNERSPKSEAVISIICECYKKRKTYLPCFTEANTTIVLYTMMTILMRFIIYCPSLSKVQRKLCLRILQNVNINDHLLREDLRWQVSLFVSVMMCLGLHSSSTPDLLDFDMAAVRRFSIVQWALDFLAKHWVVCFVLIDNERQPHLMPLGSSIPRMFGLSFAP
jgi:hypothetical protein